ncbi:MAG TPA: MobF family relaxase [Mycobacteriales bacterium]|nr:MobF family relaxase [Mycobacteriales bacterium]
MISISRLGSGSTAADYYLEKQAGCELDYYTGVGEAAGRWLGDGARALGLDGALNAAGEQMLRGLLSGCGGDGRPLVKPVLRADPRGLLLAEPLVRALDATGRRSGADLLGDAKTATAFDMAVAAVDAGKPSTLPADLVGQVAAAAGLDAVALYRSVDGTDTYTPAFAHAGAKVDVRRAGLDVTVSAPKSVSLLFGIGDPAMSKAVRAAHDVGVSEVVAYLQRHAATAARGHHGGGRRAPRIGTDGLIVAAFDHRTSRAGDPQMHTHLVIPNLVRGADGRWSAMDTNSLYRHARTASSLYHAVLRGELTKTLGVAWTRVDKGIAEVDGIPRSTIEHFSKRRGQIVDEQTRRGWFSTKAAQVACLVTRPAKTHETPATLRGRWAEEAATVGLDALILQRLTGRTGGPDEPAIDVLATRLFGPAGVTADRTTFTRQDLAQAICETLPAGTPVRLADVDRLVTTLIAHPDVLPVVGDGPQRRYTTRELVATEQHALTLADSPRERPVRIIPARHVGRLIVGSGLSDEQQAMVTALVSSRRHVDVVTGPAGSGKTAALAQAARLWSLIHRPVQGATVAWRAAQNLEAATGIPTRSVAATLRSADTHGLPAGVVLVVDEASLVNTRTLTRLLEHVHRADGTLVLVGDPEQLPEIGAGGLFAALADRDTTIRLTDNQRQHATWERAALTQLREGDSAGALDAYVNHDRVHTTLTSGELLEQVAADYAAAAGRGEQVLVLAARRVDVAQLNRHIREHLIHAGALGGDELRVPSDRGPRAYRVGDQVLVTVNDRDRGLLNGTRATITDLQRRRGTVELRTDAGQRVVLDRNWLASGHLEPGYASTMHKAQGVTVDTTLIYGAGPLTREHAYVALSRGRLANHIYLAVDTVDIDICGPQVNQARLDEVSLTADLLERISVSGSHQLASRQTWPPTPEHDDGYGHVRDLINHHDNDRGYGLSR